MGTLLNQGIFDGLFLGDELEVYSTQSSVELIDGLTATKTADRTKWANGELEYTIVINNLTTAEYTTPILTDQIDTALSNLVANSVIVGTEIWEYDYTGGLLTVELPTIPAGGSLTIKFKVVRV